MSLWAIVPVKSLKQGKTRLAEVLSEDERYVLNTTMLGNMLNSLQLTHSIDQILVISRDPWVLSISHDFGAQTLHEELPSNLNSAVTLAVNFAIAGHADRVMVIPSDIPLIKSIHIQDFAAQMTSPNQMVIIPDRREDGTNGLMIAPPDSFTFQFGAGSFHLHIRQAEQIGLRVDVLRIPAFELDLDLPEDLALFQTMIIPKP
jgi:2-phospho-L-lactate guanylyltransferase